ncbi:hypothetical protein PENTCL1PPCAC_25786, partial [Pristionchus entomophagus]
MADAENLDQHRIEHVEGVAEDEFEREQREPERNRRPHARTRIRGEWCANGVVADLYGFDSKNGDYDDWK